MQKSAISYCHYLIFMIRIVILSESLEVLYIHILVANTSNSIFHI